MEILKPVMKNLVAESASGSNLLKRNLLKEYLQIVVLNFIYSHPCHSKLIFYGGSCLAQCFGLPRLSEDLDFVDEKKKADIADLARDLKKYFEKNTDLEVKAGIQKFRVYLKFPLLHDFGLSKKSETDFLLLKVEVFSGFDFCRKYKTEIRPLFRFNRSMLVRTFDLPTLMATKIRAVLHRKWKRMDKTGNILVRVKGRDYFDLMWYLEQGVKPNLDCIEDVKNTKELKKKLLEIVSRVDAQSIRLDIEALVEDLNFVNRLSKDMKNILIRGIEEKL